MPQLHDIPLSSNGGTRLGPAFITRLFSWCGRFPFNDSWSCWSIFWLLRPSPRWWRRSWCCLPPVVRALIFRWLRQRQGCWSIPQGISCPLRWRLGFFPLHVFFLLLRPHSPYQIWQNLRWPALLLALCRELSCRLPSIRPKFCRPQRDPPSRRLSAEIISIWRRTSATTSWILVRSVLDGFLAIGLNCSSEWANCATISSGVIVSPVVFGVRWRYLRGLKDT